jgi:polyisoprenoid-binding protein YceI
MKSKAKYLHAACIALMLLVATTVRAQSVVRFEADPDKSKVRVDGTSTVHDWHVETPSINGYIEFKIDVPADADTETIRKAIVANPQATCEVAIASKSLKSEKKDMDKKMYESLKADRHQDILYQLTAIELKDPKADSNEFKVKTTGNLSIAGVTRELKMQMTLNVVDATHLRVTGELWMNMSDFKLKRPEAMLGMIKAGDGINIQFEWNTVRAAAPATAVAEQKK